MFRLKSPVILIVILSLLVLSSSGCSILNVEPGSLQVSDAQTLNAPKPKPDNGQLVFRLADNWSSDYPSVLGDKEFARLVELRSNGKLKIIVYPDAVLGDEKSVIEQVQIGGIDFARVNSAPLIKASDKLTVLSLPYLFRDKDHLWNVLLGPIGDELLESLKDGGIVGLSYFDSGARSFYSKKPIYKISDLKGLKIRVQQSDIFGNFIKSLGAIPVPMAFGEVYDALQKDEVDGAENNWSSYYYTNHYKFAKYYVLDEHTRNPEVLIASSKVINRLSKEYRDIINSAAKDAVAYQRKAWIEAEMNSIEKIKNSGAVITPLTFSEKEQLQETISPLYETYGKEYKSLIERIRNTK